MSKQLAINKKLNNISVSVSPFVELLAVIYTLSNFGLNATRKNGKYLEDINNFFNKFKSHKAIKKFKELLQINSFKYDAPVELILNIETDSIPSEELLSRANLTIEKYNLLKEDILNFYKESNFEKFYVDNTKLYQNNIDTFISTIKSYSPDKYLFDFLNLSTTNLNIVLMHGVTTSNYGLNIDNTLHCMVRPYKLSRFNNMDFAFDLPYITSLILHEFGHSFINPLTDKYLEDDRINKTKLKTIMENHSYGDHYKTAINETIIRAIECNYIKNMFPNNYITFKQDYIEEGFDLIDELLEFYNKYTNDKKETETIEDYYKKLLEIFYK
ncbi:MAG: DUF4932 domain-containing protein [Clostridia bacterium]|nr:DUF4932 domain-containing protein [Clostridia bacterium]